jgi:hypothetical protein
MSPQRFVAAGAVLGGVLAASPACSGDSTSPQYDPDLPTAWAAAVTNPFFPLAAGTAWQYAAGNETNTVEVLAQTRVVYGVTATVVHDQVFINGILREDTYDWFAQDSAGNVWYVGEDTKELNPNGQVVSTEGSFEWGVDGGLPGIIMWADPSAHIGEKYRQEFLRGEAEDWGRVLRLGASVTVPAGSYANCLETEDWNGLESGAHEHKFYCPAVGTVLEVGGNGDRTELTSVTIP